MPLLRIARIDGGYSQNRILFSKCQAFLGEATISFEPTLELQKASKAHPAAALESRPIPAGLYFSVSLKEGIDAATAAAGDSLNAQLVTPLQTREEIIAPAGTAISARIVGLRYFYGKNYGLSLEVKLESIEIGGVRVPLIAHANTGSRYQKRAALTRRIELGTRRGVEERATEFVFLGAPETYLIRTGLESNWVTDNPHRRD